MDDLKLSQDRKEKLQLFNACDSDIHSAGSLRSRFGALVGIPMNFAYEKIDVIKNIDLFLNNKPIDFSKQVSKYYLNSLILSENAQKFAMAREIILLQRNPGYVFLQLIFHIVAAALLYAAIYKKLKFDRRKKLYTHLFTFVCYSLTILTWFPTINFINYESDRHVDLLVSKLGPEYIQGGKEFYGKLLNRNIALRTLLGDEGKKLFTINGDRTHFLIKNGAPILDRKNFFDSLLKNTEQLM